MNYDDYDRLADLAYDAERTEDAPDELDHECDCGREFAVRYGKTRECDKCGTRWHVVARMLGRQREWGVEATD